MTPEEVIRAEILRLAEERTNEALGAGGGPDPIRQEISRLLMEQEERLAEGPGFFERVGRALVPGSPEDVGLVAASALSSGILGPAQAIAEIPGLFTEVELPFDRAADFLERARLGIVSQAEEAALESGMTPQAVADAKLFGEIVGYTAPVVASLKATRLITGIRGRDLTLARQFHLDTAAGLVFGSTLKPEDEIRQRMLNTLQESALFGVGSLVISGPLFAARGMRLNSLLRGRQRELLEEDLARIARGERTIFDGEDELADFVAQISNEEGYLAASPRAHQLLQEFEFDSALIAGVRDWNDSGLSRGFVEGIGTDFQTVQQQLVRAREQFPNLKFDVVKREGLFDLHFGLTGLNNQQKAQLAREGNYAGQLVQKGEASYLYVRRGKGDRMVVRTVDGKVTTITPDNVTVLPSASEEIPLPTAGQALYESYRQFVFEKMRQAAGMSGDIPETDLIRFIRQGQIPDLEGARVFETPGAITHQGELGRFPSGRKFEVALTEATEEGASFSIINAQGEEVGNVVGAFLDDVYQVIDMGLFQELGAQGTIGTGTLRQLARSLVEQLQSRGIQIRAITGVRSTGAQPGRVQGFDVEDLMRGGQEPRDFVQGFLEEGKHTGDLLRLEPVRRQRDAFELWAREQGLDLDAADIEAVRQNFAQRLRSDIWDLLPDEEAATLRRVHEEMFRLVEADELPFETLAGAKGFHVERTAGQDAVVLRDINTGARMTFANQEVANRTLRRVVRTEKDPMWDYLTPGPHGGMALTVGFDPTDGVFTFDTNLAPQEMLLRLPSQALTNVRDYMDALEQVSKIPFFSQGFERIDGAMLRMQQRYEPQSQQIADIWKGIPRGRRKAVAEFWTDVEGTDLSGAALNRAARDAGLSTREIQAFTRSRRMFDLGAEQIGLPESRFISNYYSRLRAMYEEGLSQDDILRAISDDPVFHREYQFWAEMTRTGELSQIELDPEIVMHKYFRALAYKQEVAPLENQFRTMLNTRIRDLAPEQQQLVLRRALPETDVNSFVLPPPIRDYAKEYINAIRGDLNPGFESARQHFLRLTRGLGMEVDPRVVDELHSTYLSMQYGAALGLRLNIMNRNAVQNLWMMYTRVGAKHGGTSLERAMTLEGYAEALQAGAIRSTSGATPFYDAIFDQWFGPEVARGSGPLSIAAASVLRKAIRAGRITRKVAEKFLVPYGSGDQVNRAWAYHWQKQHTAEWLERFQAGRINWDTFLDDGLPFFSDTIKSQFRQRYDRLGSEAALQYIGKQAADEAHFIYGSASSPPWMQRPFMRLFGMFGQWPLWAKQMYINRMANASSGKQVAAFWGRTIALTGMFANMTVQSGISMWNWIAPVALNYTGGPVTELAIQTRNVIDQPMDRKAAAFQRLASEAGSLVLPGQLFWREVTTALDADDPTQAALLLSLGRPADRGNFNFDILLNPESPEFTPRPRRPQLPEIEGLPPIR